MATADWAAFCMSVRRDIGSAIAVYLQAGRVQIQWPLVALF